jgi:hypothetical protein
VESLIVVSTFILLFLGMVFFRDLYSKSFKPARLARATVIAYSMAGCPSGKDPGTWAGTDLSPKAGTYAPALTQTPVSAPNQPAIPSKRAQKVMGEIPGAGSNGSTINPIADLGFTLKAGATTTSGKLGARKGFVKAVGATSFVSCGEAVRDDDFKGIVGYALSKFNLFKGSEESDTP